MSSKARWFASSHHVSCAIQFRFSSEWRPVWPQVVPRAVIPLQRSPPCQAEATTAGQKTNRDWSHPHRAKFHTAFRLYSQFSTCRAQQPGLTSKYTGYTNCHSLWLKKSSQTLSHSCWQSDPKHVHRAHQETTGCSLMAGPLFIRIPESSLKHRCAFTGIDPRVSLLSRGKMRQE